MRILVGFILALSITFACDQPYEEIEGYKIGCPFVVAEELEIANEEPFLGAKVYTKKIDGIFEKETIIVADGIIEAVMLSKDFDDRSSSNKINQKDIDDVLDALNKKWGHNERDNKLPNHYIWRPDSDVIGKIEFISLVAGSEYPPFVVFYMSKNAVKLVEKEALLQEER